MSDKKKILSDPYFEYDLWHDFLNPINYFCLGGANLGLLGTLNSEGKENYLLKSHLPPHVTSDYLSGRSVYMRYRTRCRSPPS